MINTSGMCFKRDTMDLLEICRVSEADTEFDTTIGHIEDIIMGMYACVHLCCVCVYTQCIVSYC